MSKLGVHVVIGPRTRYGPFLQRIAAAGQTLALVKCVDDFGAAYEAKQVMPRVLTIGRINEVDHTDLQAYEPLTASGYVDAAQVASWYYAKVKPKWLVNRQWIDVWETFSEFSAHWAWQSDFYLALMDLAEADGFKLALYACSSGNPPDAVTVMQMLSCLKAARQRGHYLSLHEYGDVGTDIVTLSGTQPYHALRYRQLYESILIPNGADPLLIISECGQNGGSTFPGEQTFLNDFCWYDSELMKDPYVVGAAIFTLGNWASTNFQTALPALADYIATTPTPPPLPKQPLAAPYVFGQPPIYAQQSPARGLPRDQCQRIYVLLPNEPLTAEGDARSTQWAQAVVEGGLLAHHRLTLGFSADDAGIGDLDRRHILAINPETWPGSLVDFYNTYYAGVDYTSMQAATPDELRRLLTYPE